MLVDALFLSILIAFARGGDVRHLVAFRLRAPWAIVTALGLQTILPFMVRTGLPAAAVVLVFLAGYVLLLAPLWLNRSDWRLALVGVGVALNLAAFVANGGMPVFLERPAALGGVELAADGLARPDALHLPMTDGSRLKFFGDWIRLPRISGAAALLSPGDVLISLGVFLFIQRAMIYRGRRRADASQAPGRTV